MVVDERREALRALAVRRVEATRQDRPIVCCQILQQLLQNLPWAHLCTIMDKAAEHRDWYARAAVKDGWSRRILVMQIETGAHDRFGKATTNFERTLPKPRSDLARETLKDP